MSKGGRPGGSTEFLKSYSIGKEVGSGTSSRVFEAREQMTGRRVALKVIEGSREGAGVSTTKECELLQEFDSPYIVGIIDFAKFGSKVYVVTEYLDGGDLFDAIIKAGSFSEHDAADHTKQILRGLRVLHAKHVCHRDLKPENIMLSKGCGTRIAKIADLGLAAKTEGTLQEACGTIGYCSPQIYLNQPYTVATDLWSLGVIVFIMLTGREPFNCGVGEEAVLDDAVKGKYDFGRASVSASGRDFVGRLLQVEEAERMTAEEALEHPWLRGASSGVIGDDRERRAKCVRGRCAWPGVGVPIDEEW
jgi:serine/threonine protein kinase